MDRHHSSGEGSISRRGDGRWQASLQVGRVRRTVYGRTRSEVAAKLADLKRQAATSGALPDPGRRTVDDLLDTWLEAETPSWKPTTRESYVKVCDHDIRPALGTWRLNRLSPEAVHRLCARLQKEGKARTALKVYRALAAACDLAVRWGWLASNPCARVDVPRYRPERKEVWSHAELRRFLEGTRGHPLHALWLTAICSGARLGELLALEWSDVDLESGTLRIAKTRAYVSGEAVTLSPKTASGLRVVTLPVEAVQALRKHRATWCEQRLALGARWRGGERVFIHAPTTIGRALRAECIRLRVPIITMHGLRHLHASLLLAEGAPLPVVSARLGHANTQVTASVYAHYVRGQDDGAQVISKALRPAGGPTAG